MPRVPASAEPMSTAWVPVWFAAKHQTGIGAGKTGRDQRVCQFSTSKRRNCFRNPCVLVSTAGEMGEPGTVLEQSV